jgi:hypothetical protein
LIIYVLFARFAHFLASFPFYIYNWIIYILAIGKGNIR